MIKNNTGEDLLRFSYKKYKFIPFDYETESLNLCVLNKPREIGYAIIENGNVTKSFNQRIWWEDLNISEDAARITRFNYQDYKNTSEKSELVLNKFENELYDPNAFSITYNGLNFDIYIHQLWRKKMGKEVDWTFLPRSIDVLSLSRAYRMEMEPPNNWEDFFFWQIKLANYFEDARLRKDRKLPSCTLSSMAKELDIAVDEGKTHQGLYDVILTWEVFKKLLYKMEISEKVLTI